MNGDALDMYCPTALKVCLYSSAWGTLPSCEDRRRAPGLFSERDRVEGQAEPKQA
jgi:hypothetical protein